MGPNIRHFMIMWAEVFDGFCMETSKYNSLHFLDETNQFLAVSTVSTDKGRTSQLRQPSELDHVFKILRHQDLSCVNSE